MEEVKVVVIPGPSHKIRSYKLLPPSQADSLLLYSQKQAS